MDKFEQKLAEHVRTRGGQVNVQSGKEFLHSLCCGWTDLQRWRENKKKYLSQPPKKVRFLTISIKLDPIPGSCADWFREGCYRTGIAPGRAQVWGQTPSAELYSRAHPSHCWRLGNKRAHK